MSTPFKLHAPLTRSVQVADVELSKNTLEAILVPWNTPSTVTDITEDGVDTYEEGFRPEAFDLQMREHPGTIRDVILLPRHGSTEMFGHAKHIEPQKRGLHAVMSVLPSRMGDVKSMYEAGIDKVSIEFHPLQRAPRTTREDPVRWRTAAWLKAVAMTPIPAYEEASVLAVRKADQAEKLKAKRLADLEAELAELRAGGERWH